MCLLYYNINICWKTSFYHTLSTTPFERRKTRKDWFVIILYHFISMQIIRNIIDLRVKIRFARRRSGVTIII